VAGGACRSSGTSNTSPAVTKQSESDPQFDAAFQKFYTTYRLGPGDIIAVRVQGQPEYSKDQLKVSPVGAIYLELIGDISVAGMTLEQTKDYLTKELSEYLKDPKVMVSLLDAVSAKVGVLGEVMKPGIVVMARPMNLLDAIQEAGGFATTGSKSNVEVIRSTADGNRKPMRVNVKHILEGKSNPADNVMLQPGDIVYVHGNAMKTISTVTALAGFGSFLSFIQFGRR
jgi:polysaccharide export outer membrane protein